MIKYKLLLLILVLCIAKLQAQNLRICKSESVDTFINGTPFTNEINLITSINASEFAQQDEMISPLTYSGYGYGAQLGLQFVKFKRIANFGMNYNKATLYTNLQAKQYNTELTHFNSYININYSVNKLDYHYLRSYLGWQIAQHADFRRGAQFQNSSLTYNFSCSVAPTYRVKKLYTLNENKDRWVFKKGFHLEWNYQFALPVITALSRPNYNGIRTLKDGNGNRYQNSIQKEVIDHFQLYSFNKLVAFESKLELQYLMQNGNKWALQFNWVHEKFTKEHYQYRNDHTGLVLCFYSRLN